MYHCNNAHSLRLFDCTDTLNVLRIRILRDIYFIIMFLVSFLTGKFKGANYSRHAAKAFTATGE